MHLMHLEFHSGGRRREEEKKLGVTQILPFLRISEIKSFIISPLPLPASVVQ